MGRHHASFTTVFSPVSDAHLPLGLSGRRAAVSGPTSHLCRIHGRITMGYLDGLIHPSGLSLEWVISKRVPFEPVESVLSNSPYDNLNRWKNVAPAHDSYNRSGTAGPTHRHRAGAVPYTVQEYCARFDRSIISKNTHVSHLWTVTISFRTLGHTYGTHRVCAHVRHGTCTHQPSFVTNDSREPSHEVDSTSERAGPGARARGAITELPVRCSQPPPLTAQRHAGRLRRRLVGRGTPVAAAALASPQGSGSPASASVAGHGRRRV